MSTAELQACMARIYVDESFRRLSRIDPKATIDRYALTDDERAAVLKVDARMVDYFAGSLRNKRRARFEIEYPAVFAADRARALSLWDRFYDLLGTNPYLSQKDALRQFGLFLTESIRLNPSWPEWLTDVTRFETAVCGGHPAAETDSPRPDDTSTAGPLRLVNGVSLYTFGYDVLSIENAIRENSVTQTVEPSFTPIAVCRSANSQLRSFQLSEPAWRVLTWCDGDRTLDDLVGRAEEFYGAVGLGPSITVLVHRLIALEVCEVS